MGQKTVGDVKKKLSRSNVSTAAKQPLYIEGLQQAGKLVAWHLLNYRREFFIFTLFYCRTAELDKMMRITTALLPPSECRRTNMARGRVWSLVWSVHACVRARAQWPAPSDRKHLLGPAFFFFFFLMRQSDVNTVLCWGQGCLTRPTGMKMGIRSLRI